MSSPNLAVIAPLRERGVPAHSIAFALRALAAEGWSIEVLDVTKASDEPLPSWFRRLCYTYDVRLATEGLKPGPDVLVAMQLKNAWAWQEALSELSPGAALVIDEAVPRSSRWVNCDLPDSATDLLEICAKVHDVSQGPCYVVCANESRRSALSAAAEDLGLTWLVVEDWMSRVGPSLHCMRQTPRTMAKGAARAIGRHGAQGDVPWERDPDLLRSALGVPTGWSVVMGGDLGGLKSVIGQVPLSWNTGVGPSLLALASIDYWLQLTDGLSDEIVDLAVDEALAAGAVVVLHPSYQYWYGNAALYSSNKGVRAFVKKIETDPTQARNASRRALRFASEVSSDHLLGLMRRIAPTKEPTAVKRVLPRGDRERFRVAFVTSNGAGMGHLTRLLGIARRMPPDVEPFFVSLSSAVPVVKLYDIGYTYIASRGDSSMGAAAWNSYARARFQEEFELLRPDTIVFDGTWPYRGFLEAARQSGAALVWSLRGMWRQGTRPTALSNSDQFDLVLAPGDVAQRADRGPSGFVVSRATHPVTLVGRGELLARDAARQELGIQDADRAVLVTLGAGALNDIDAVLDDIVDEVSMMQGNWQIFVTTNPIGVSGRTQRMVNPIRRYPLAPLLRAFDFAVSAAGYNSVHECVMAGLPSLWLPNTSTQTDDQVARATFLEEEGAGICLVDPGRAEVRAALKVMGLEENRMKMRTKLATLDIGEGASEAASIIYRLTRGESV